jgi:hypothetical protein
VLGLVRPCSTHLDQELRDRWRAHLCGVCLTLRDTAGQPARAVTNTDAVLLSILVEAQQPDGAATRTAGPCALRGMARAQVIAPEELSVRLGATAALTLSAAKVGDKVSEQEQGLGPRRRGANLLRRAEGRLGRQARADLPVAAAADVPTVLAGLSVQAAIEARGGTLAEVTAPTAEAVGAMFRASAQLSGCPENADPLAAAGRAYGEFAHLADALEDLDADRRRGEYNPLDATGTSREVAIARLRDLRRTVIDRLGEVRLRDDRLVRPLLLASMGAAILSNSSTLGRPITDRSLIYRTLHWGGVYCTGYALCCDHTNACSGKRHEGTCRDCACDDCCCDCDGCCCDGTP